MKYNILILFILIIHIITFEELISSEEDQVIIHLNFSGEDVPPGCFFPHSRLEQPKIGLALSGGGARGLFQIGVLQVMVDNNLPIDFIVGVSMGATIGGLYASGYSPYEIEKIVKEIKWDEIIIDTPPRTNLFIGQKEERDRSILQIRLKGLKPVIPQSITAGQKLSSILTDLTMRVASPVSPDFDKLRVRFRVLACDLVSGNKILLNEGNLAEAMKASMAFPLLFSPVQRDGMLLVDGGLINNIPVDEVRAGGVDLVIAVNATSSLHEKDRLRTPWVIADQVTTIMQREKKKQQQDRADIVISLQREDYKSDNFDYIDSLIIRGREETQKQIDTIKHIIKKIKEDRIPGNLYQIDKFILYGFSNSRIRDEITKQVEPQIKKQLSHLELYNILEQIYETGFFAEVYAKIDNQILNINVQENPQFKRLCFSGNSVFPDSILANNVSSKTNEPINYYTSKIDLKNIINLYKQNGYSLAQIKEVNLCQDTLRIIIDEGIISKIILQGNERTSNYVILRELPLKPGDIFNIEKASTGITNIHSTDLFSNVSYEIKNVNDSNCVVIKLTEKAFSVFRAGLRNDLERKGKGFIELVDENILGSATKFSFFGLYGLRDQALNIELRSDRIFNSFLTYQFDLFFNKAKDYSYLSGKQVGEYYNFSKGFSFSVGQQIKRLGMLSASIQLNLVDLKTIAGYGYPVGKTELKSFTIQSVVDTRDMYPFPTKGKYYNFFYEISSGAFLNSQVSFFKIFSSLETYFTFLKRNTLHPRVSWGASDLTTPFTEQFRLGGIDSFYGLNENEHIGRYLFLTSLEYRYFFPFKTTFDFYWIARYDLGSTWKTAEEIKPKDVVQGLGTGLAINTILGPIQIAYGWNNVGKRLAYFSAGFEF